MDPLDPLFGYETYDPELPILLPSRGRGRRTKYEAVAADCYRKNLCRLILDIYENFGFPISARGWCYILEEYGLNKGDFDRAAKEIADCRRMGLLDIAITSEDDARESRSNQRTLSDLDAEDTRTL